MGTKRYLMAAILGGAMIAAGCDRSPSQPKANTNQAVPPPSAEDVKAKAEKAAEEGKAAAAKAGNAIKENATDAKEAVTGAADKARTSETVQNAQATAGDAMAKAKEQGSDLLAKLETAVKANKLDEAQTYVDAFEKIKDKVPAELRDKYVTLKAQLSSAKAAAADKAKELNK